MNEEAETSMAGEVEAAAQQIRLVTRGDLEPHINQDKIVDQTAQVLAVTLDDPKPPNHYNIVDQTAQVLAVTPDDPKPPNRDKLDPGKAQAAHSAKIETCATLQLDEPSSSTKYIVKF